MQNNLVASCIDTSCIFSEIFHRIRGQDSGVEYLKDQVVYEDEEDMENEVQRKKKRRRRSLFKSLFSRKPSSQPAASMPFPLALPVPSHSFPSSHVQPQQVLVGNPSQLLPTIALPINPPTADSFRSYSYKTFPVIYPAETPTSSATCRSNPEATHEMKTNMYSAPAGYGSKSILVECKENIDRMRREWQAKQRAMEQYSSS